MKENKRRRSKERKAKKRNENEAKTNTIGRKGDKKSEKLGRVTEEEQKPKHTIVREGLREGEAKL